MVLWRLCSSVTCSWVRSACTPGHADMPLIPPSWASWNVWASSGLSSLDACSWISPRSDRECNFNSLHLCGQHVHPTAGLLWQASTSAAGLQCSLPRYAPIPKECHQLPAPFTAFQISPPSFSGRGALEFVTYAALRMLRCLPKVFWWEIHLAVLVDISIKHLGGGLWRKSIA